MAYIYRILNTTNNKNYIGVTLNFHQRKLQHIRALKNNNHHNQKLQAAWNKYGESAFQFDILLECDDQDRFQEEIKYIALYDSFNQGYNLTKGGDKGGEEFFAKNVYVYDLQGNYIKSFPSRAEAERILNCHSIKECCLGSCKRGFSQTDQQWYQFSYNCVENIGVYKRQKSNTKPIYQINDQKQIIARYESVADALRACGLSPKTHNLRDANNNHSKFHGYYWCYVENFDNNWEPLDIKMNKIVAFDLQGNVIGYYFTAKDAAQQLKLDNSSVCKVLKGTRQQCGGYTFKYI